MKLLISQNDFISSLQIALNAVPQKSTLPILGHILLDAYNNTLTFSATDLDVSIKTECPASISEEGSLALPARKLFEIIREIPSDTDIELETNETDVQLSAGRGIFKIKGLEREEFPNFPTVDEKNRFTFSLAKLQYMLKKIIFATSNDESRPTLNGINWELNKENFKMVATDGHRLGYITIGSLKNAIEDDINIIVPPKGLRALNQISDNDADMEIIIGENQIIFQAPGTTIYSRLIEGPFPNYKQVIPAEADKRAVIDKKSLIPAVKRVSILSNIRNYQVRFNFTKDLLTVKVQTPDLGEAKEDLTIDWEGEDLLIGYNAHYVLEILKALDTDNIVWELTTSTNAGVIKPLNENENESLLYLIMPLRIED